MSNPFDPGYYRTDELRGFGFKRVGENVRISRNCTIIGPENIEIGHDVQIDSFTTIIANAGWLKLGNFIHICTNVLLGCRGGIDMGDFTAASHGSRLISCSDDFSGEWLLSTAVPPEYVNVDVRPIILRDHAAVCVQGVVLPGVTMEAGTILGALSLANRDLREPWTIYGGVPAAPVKRRTQGAVVLGNQLMGYALAAE